MRKTFILCVLIFLALMGVLFYAEYGLSRQNAAAENAHKAATIPAVAKESAPPAETQIRAKIEEYYRIARTGDRAALTAYSEKIAAPEYLYSSELGVKNRAEAFRFFDSLDIKPATAEFKDFAAQVHGDTAIAKYLDVVQAGDKRFYSTRFTSVWLRRDGQWQIVAEHSSRLAPPKLLPGNRIPDHLAKK